MIVVKVYVLILIILLLVLATLEVRRIYLQQRDIRIELEHRVNQLKAEIEVWKKLTKDL